MAVSTPNRFIDPGEFASVPVFDLLTAASQGYAGIDQRFIRAILDRGVSAVPDLLRFGLADHSGDPVSLEEDLIAIFRYLRTPEALPFYIRCIREAPEDVTDELIDAVIPFHEKALDPLLALYEELGEERGSDVAFLLAALGVRDERILKILTERLEYDAGDAALALSVYRDPASKPALEAMLAKIPEEEETLRREFTLALSALEEGAAPETEEHLGPFDIWDMYPEEATPPVEALSESQLLEMLSSSSAAFRTEAALSFRNRTEYSKPVRDRLFEITRTDPEAKVRAAAWEALGEKASEPQVRDALKAALADEKRDLVERAGALVGLAGATDDKKVSQQVIAFYKRPETRAKALEAMWRSFDPQFHQYFPKHLEDADREVRRAAIWGAGYSGNASLAGKLETMFQDHDYRADALFAYALLTPGEVSHGRIPGMFRKINEVAGGLSYGEAELVEAALDQRLIMHGLDPYFSNSEGDDWNEDDQPAPAPAKEAPPPGRNDPCPCGSGKKYKKCHGA